jgi:hypothetical protein
MGNMHNQSLYDEISSIDSWLKIGSDGLFDVLIDICRIAEHTVVFDRRCGKVL